MKWEDIESSLFYIINGQQNVAASKKMMDEDSGVDNDTKADFQK